jgi:hypothetical protein
MLTPLPAAFLMICSALPSRSLCSKLRRGRGGEVGACTGACVWIHPSAAGGRGRSDVHRHAAHDYREGTVYRADENVEGVQEAGRKTPLGKGPRKDMRSLYLCSLIDARRNVQGREEVFANVLQLTRKRTLCGAAAHYRLVIFVLLRMAASAVAPLPPILLSLRLRNEEWRG